jgi:hypothetical protein
MTQIPTVYEKRWPTIILAPISIANHVVTVSDTVGLHTKQKVVLSKAGEDTQEFEIKRVLSDTELIIGSIGGDINDFQNPTQFSGGMLVMSEQIRNHFGSEVVMRAVYEEEPAVALRNVLVSKYGQHADYINKNGINRLAVDADLTITDITVNISNPSNIIISNIATPGTPNTEFSIVIPANTKRFTLRVQEDQSATQISMTSGASGTTYSKISPGETWLSGDMNLTAPLTIYAQVKKANLIMELTRWI